MRVSLIVTKFSAVLRAFRRADRGNVAIMLGLSIVPVVGITGAAVDYSRTNSVKAEMQTALDSTALMLAKEAAVVGQATVNANAQKYFNAIFQRKDVTDVAANAVYTPGGTSQLVVNASAQVPTAFVKIFGYDSLTVNGSATAKWVGLLRSKP